MSTQEPQITIVSTGKTLPTVRDMTEDERREWVALRTDGEIRCLGDVCEVTIYFDPVGQLTCSAGNVST